MTYRWDYRSSPYVRIGFWMLLVLAGFAMAWAGRTEVEVYTRGEGLLEKRGSNHWLFMAKLPEDDLTRLKVGMPASIGWTAYPRAQYGMSQGQVQKIAIAENHLAVTVQLKSSVLETLEQTQPLQPGLSGSVQVVLARKKALELLWEWLKG